MLNLARFIDIFEKSCYILELWETLLRLHVRETLLRFASLGSYFRVMRSYMTEQLISYLTHPDFLEISQVTSKKLLEIDT